MGEITSAGVWISETIQETRGTRAALFLDRDGVLVKETHYLSRTEDVALEDGACALLAWAREQGLAAVVVTNQAGIARNYFGWTEFEAVQSEIARQLAAQGCAVDLVLACPFHPEHTPGYAAQQAHWRKPGPGMLLHAASILAVDLSASWMIGDNDTDIGAARNAGLAGAIHVMTGHGAETRGAALALADASFTVISVLGLVEAKEILAQKFQPT